MTAKKGFSAKTKFPLNTGDKSADKFEKPKKHKKRAKNSKAK